MSNQQEQQSTNPERKRSIEEMSKEELVAMFNKIRTQTLQIAAEKKTAMENYESCLKEKEELRGKALTVLQRCKELEERNSNTDALRKECEEQAELIKNLQDALHSRQNDSSNAESRVLNLANEQISTLNENLTNKDKEISSLKGKLEDLTRNNDEMHNQMKITSAKVLERMKELNAQLQDKTNEATAASNKVTELEAALAKELANSSDQNPIVEALKADISLKNETLAAATEQLNALNEQIQEQKLSLSERLSELQQQVQNLSEQRNDLQTELARHVDENATLIAEKGAAVMRVTELETSLAIITETADGKVAELESSLEAAKAAADAAVTETGSEYEKKIAALKTEVDNLRSELSSQQEAHSAAKAEIVTTHNKEKEELKEELRIVNDKLQVAVATSEQGSSETARMIEELQGECNMLREKVTTLETGKAQTEEKAQEQVRKALEKLREMSEELKSQKSAVEEAVTAKDIADGKVAELESSLEAAKAAADAAVTETGSVTTNFHNLLSECSQLKEELKTLSERLELQESSLAVANTENSEREQLLAARNAKLSELESEIGRFVSSIAAAAEEKNLMQEKITYQDAKMLEMTELETKLRERVRALKAQRSEAQQSVSVFENQVSELQLTIAQHVDHIRSLEYRLQAQDNALEQLQQLIKSRDNEVEQLRTESADLANTKSQIKELEAQLECGNVAPPHFEVLLRCSDGERNWCLIRAGTSDAKSSNDVDVPATEEQDTDNTRNDGNMDALSWHTESKIRSWIMEQQLKRKEKISGSAEESFTIDEEEEDEIVLPAVVQESLQLAFEADREVLLRRIEELEAEKQQSQQAFDTYRDRARSSLLKSANDHKLAEENVAKMAAQLKLAEKKALKAEEKCTQLESDHAQSIAVLRGENAQERDSANALRTDLDTLRSRLENAAQNDLELRNKIEMLEKHLADAQENQSIAQSDHLIAHCKELEDIVESLKSKEKQLLAEMKKKGDTARNIIISKDEEISALKLKLKAAVEAGSAAVKHQDHLRDALHVAQTVQLSAAGCPDKNGTSVASPSNDSALKQTGHYHNILEFHLGEDDGDPISSSSAQVANGKKNLGDDRSDDVATFADSLIGTSSVDTQAPSAVPTSTAEAEQRFSIFKKELGRRALERETELINKLKHLESEVRLLRSRQSLFGGKQGHSSVERTGSISKSQSKDSSTVLGDTEGVAASDEGEKLATIDLNATSIVEENDQFVAVSEQEQRLLYLRQAFCGFVRAKHGVEMQHLGRVMCAILGIEEDDQAEIIEHIGHLAPAVVATTTIETLTQNISSLFS